MREQVQRTIQEFNMVLPGQRVAVACSGGPDSTALLLILQEMSNPLGCVLSVAHFNHQLRAEESEEDEKFVRELAERLGLPLRVGKADVRGAARRAGFNLEAQARQMRYGFLLSLVAEGWADRVAVGHTADDQAETVLHRFLRGAGTRGLAGIYPVVGGTLVRPLIRVRRQAVEDWLRAHHQPWQEDSSNQDLRHVRNRIRHQLLPRLSRFNPRLVETACEMAEIARHEEAFWQQYLVPLVNQGLRLEGMKVLVDVERLQQRHAGFHHGRELARKQGNVLVGDGAATTHFHLFDSEDLDALPAQYRVDDGFAAGPHFAAHGLTGLVGPGPGKSKFLDVPLARGGGCSSHQTSPINPI